MTSSLSSLTNQVGQIWKQFGPVQRFNVAFALLLAMGLIGGLIYWSSRPDFRLLYSDLTLSDAAQMREKLEDAKIEVKVGQSGMSISVPAADLYSARLLLASAGLPGDSSSGFELFEEPKFGLTDFAQKVNYQRALQGELERTICAMQGVKGARVMLVLPKDQLFATEDEKKAQASILLTMNGSVALSDAQLQSIVHLVAGSVQSLDPSDVVVTDQNGRMLSKVTAAGDVLAQSGEQLDLQQNYESRLEEKAQAVLDRAMGVGNSIVRVSLQLDFSDIEQESQVYDAANRVATSERVFSEDQSGGTGGAGGAAGVMAQVNVGTGSMQMDEKESKKREELTTEYVVPSTVSRTRRRGIRVDQMTVAVCLAKGEAARSDDEMAAIQQMVANALGVDNSRHDSIEIAEMTFQPQQAPVVVRAGWWEQLPFSLNSAMDVLGGLAVFGVVLVVGRKVKRAILENSPMLDVPVDEIQRKTKEEVENEEPLSLQDQLAAITELARTNPKTVASWISNSVDWAD